MHVKWMEWSGYAWPIQYIFEQKGWCWERFLVNLITEYLEKTLKYAEQNCNDHPPVVVAASTGKLATNINDTPLDSAFFLPVRKGSFNQGKLGKWKAARTSNEIQTS